MSRDKSHLPLRNRIALRALGCTHASPVCDHLTWNILPKRPQSFLRFLPSGWGDGYEIVGLGVTVDDRKHGYPRVERLCKLLPAFMGALLAAGLCSALAQQPTTSQASILVVEESGMPVADASVKIEVNGTAQVLTTDQAGRVASPLAPPFHVTVEKGGFFSAYWDSDEGVAGQSEVRIILTQVPIVSTDVEVTAAAPNIDPHQISNLHALGTRDIDNIPYPTSRDIRNLLQYFPGVVQDTLGQVHVGGSEAFSVVHLLDGLDVRSPLTGSLSMRFSADGVHGIDQMSTRYPVKYGRGTGGVVAFESGMGENRFRSNVTDFMPQFEDLKGIRFDKLAPRWTLSGPVIRSKVLFFNALEGELNVSFIPEQPSQQNTNRTLRGSNLTRIQWNAAPRTTLLGGLLFNDFHSPFEGLSPLKPQQSTSIHNTIGWLYYGQVQQALRRSLLVMSLGRLEFSDGNRPQGFGSYGVSATGTQGSYYEFRHSASHNEQGSVTLHLPRHSGWGDHSLSVGTDLMRAAYTQALVRKPIGYLRANGRLERKSTFPDYPVATQHDLEAGAFLQDDWMASARWVLSPGLRFDWNEITRRPMWSPRVATTILPGGRTGNLKISAGIGLYYDRLQLEYLARSLAGARYDTYYAADGKTQLGSPVETVFSYDQKALKNSYALNWSVGIEKRLPGAIDFKANLLHKHIQNAFVYADESGPQDAVRNYRLTNNREDRDGAVEVELRRDFHAHTLFGSYSYTRAHTSAAIDYQPGYSLLGAQQGGPLPFDSLHHVSSWGSSPVPVARLRENWDFVYSAIWRSGFPYMAVNSNLEVVGKPNEHRYPDYLLLNPGVEWRFHYRQRHVGLRAVAENVTNALNPALVFNCVDSKRFGTFGSPLGRGYSLRLRILHSDGRP
jgi:hypothetical protein